MGSYTDWSRQEPLDGYGPGESPTGDCCGKVVLFHPAPASRGVLPRAVMSLQEERSGCSEREARCVAIWWF